MQGSPTSDTASEAGRPLRILMILSTPWTADLGAPRVSVQLAAALRAKGHTVEKYSIEDAFSRFDRFSVIWQSALFHRKARAFVRAHGHRFDVIQAEQEDLPFTKRDLRFSGALVARSNGLVHFYRTADQQLCSRHPNARGSLVGRALRWLANRASDRVGRADSTFRAADAIVVVNRDEYRYVSDTLGHAGKTHLISLGLTVSQLSAFGAHRMAAEVRLATPVVSFVGSWTLRKGIADMPAIVRMVRTAIPDVRFKVLGTGRTAPEVLAQFDAQDQGNIEVVASYAADQLPALLHDATVGVLPSYIEAFGLSILEQLASGVPVVAYDVPGPREMLPQLPEPVMVQAGNAAAVADRLVAVLSMEVGRYSRLADASRRVAESFVWEEVAERTTSLYAEISTYLRPGVRC